MTDFNSDVPIDDLIEQRRITAVDAVEADTLYRAMKDKEQMFYERLRERFMDGGEGKIEAGRLARISEELEQYIDDKNAHRKEAETLKADVKAYDDLFWKWQGQNATARAEMKMTN